MNMEVTRSLHLAFGSLALSYESLELGVCNSVRRS